MPGDNFNAGTVYAKLGAKLDSSGFDRWEREYQKAERKSSKPITASGKLDVDKRGFDQYDRQMKGAQRNDHDFVKSQGRVRTAFGSVWLKGGAAFAAAGGAYAAATAAKSFISTSSDISESLSKNKVLFGQYAKGVDAFSKTSAASFGISRKAALEYTGTFGNLFGALGIAKDESAKYSVELTKLGADMASFNNASPEETLNAIRSGLVGETEPLRKFGVNMNDATLKTQAMVLAKKGQIDMSKATASVLDPETKALAAMALITKQTSAAHGDFSRTSGGLANQMRILKARVTDLGGQIGDKLLPTVTAGVSGLNKLLSGDAGKGGKGAKGALDALKSGTMDLVDENRKSLGSLVDSGKKMWENMKRIFTGVKDAISDTFGGRSGTVKDIRQIAKTILTVVAAAVQVVIGLQQKLVRPVMAIFRGLLQIVRGVVRVIAGILTGDFGKAWQGVKDIFSGGIKVAIGLLKGAVTILKTAMGLVGKALMIPIRAAWNAIKSAFNAGVNGIASVLKGAAGMVASAASAVMKAIFSAIKGSAGALSDAGGWVAGKIRGGIAGLWSEFYAVGGFLMEKIKKGLEAGLGAIVDIGRNLVSKIKSGIGGAISIPFKLMGMGDPPAGSMARGWKTAGTRAFAAAFEKKYGLHFSSGYRTPAENKRAGGVPNSNHMKGTPANPGAIDLVGSTENMYAAAAEARRLGVPEVLVHDVGSGLHLHMGFYAEGGRVGPSAGGARLFVAGEGNRDEWVISQEGDKRANVRWAVEALETLTGRAVGLHKKGKGAKKKKAPPHLLTKKNRGIVRSAGRGAKGIDIYEKRIQNAEREYDQLDRRIGGGDESDFMIEDPETGTITIDEAKRSALIANLDRLIKKREEIRAIIDEYRQKAREAVTKLRAAIAKLKAALSRAKGKAREKERSGYRDTITVYNDRVKELVEIAGDPKKPDSKGDLWYDSEDATIDLEELRGERGSLLDATVKEKKDGGTGSETGGPVTAEQIASAAADQMRSFNSSRAELFASFGSNFTRAGSNPFSDSTQQAAGMRFYGATGASDNAGSGDKITNVTNNFAAPPPDAHTWTQQQRFELETL